MSYNILILAGDTDGNLGDFAILSAICATIRQKDSSAKISILSSRPDRDRQTLDVTPIRRGWRGFLALTLAARNSDLVICGGGGLFQDDDSLVKMPYWALRLVYVRIFARRIAGLSIGAGPLDHPVSRFFASLALRMLDSVSVRDDLAKASLDNLTKKTVTVVPDPAFLLTAASDDVVRHALRRANVPADTGPLVGVAVRRWFHTASDIVPHKYAAKFGMRKNRGIEEMSVFTDRVAAILDEIVEERSAHIVFMPTYNVGHENDYEVCVATASKMRYSDFTVMNIDDPAVYKGVTRQLSAMLCGRMHPAILAAAAGTAVFGLAYNQKFFGTFSLLGLQDQCIAMSDVIADDITRRPAARLIDCIDNPGRNRPDTARLEQRTLIYLDDIVDSLTHAQTPRSAL